MSSGDEGTPELQLSFNPAVLICPVLLLPPHEAPFWGELECLKKRLSVKRLNFSVMLLLPFSKGVSKKGIWLCG